MLDGLDWDLRHDRMQLRLQTRGVAHEELGHSSLQGVGPGLSLEDQDIAGYEIRGVEILRAHRGGTGGHVPQFGDLSFLGSPGVLAPLGVVVVYTPHRRHQRHRTQRPFVVLVGEFR